jgi:hypothetical protein
MSVPPNPPVWKILPPELFDDFSDDPVLDLEDDSEATGCLAGFDDLAWYDYLARDLDSFGHEYGGAL